MPCFPSVDRLPKTKIRCCQHLGFAQHPVRSNGLAASVEGTTVTEVHEPMGRRRALGHTEKRRLEDASPQQPPTAACLTLWFALGPPVDTRARPFGFCIALATRSCERHQKCFSFGSSHPHCLLHLTPCTTLFSDRGYSQWSLQEASEDATNLPQTTKIGLGPDGLPWIDFWCDLRLRVGVLVSMARSDSGVCANGPTICFWLKSPAQSLVRKEGEPHSYFNARGLSRGRGQEGPNL